MPTYKAPVEDVSFLLNDVFHFERYNNLPGFADASADVRRGDPRGGREVRPERASRRSIAWAISKAASATTTAASRPRPASRTPSSSSARAAGSALSAPAEFGGQGLPSTLAQIVNEFLTSANMAFSMYSGLTQGAVAALLAHGTPEQKKTFLPKMVTGAWAGTMNLTEPHCGTDLGLLRTKAVQQADGSYKITGTKIFISGGEQDLTENIIHLVLARIEGAPEGTKGISLFVVPKIMINADGIAWRPQRRVVRLDRAQDGHSRQFDLRDELRRRHRLAGRRGEQRPQRDVRDDERGAARRRRAGPRAVGSRLSERRRLREGAPAGPRAHGRESTGQAGRSDHRASGRAAHAADDQAFNEAARAPS